MFSSKVKETTQIKTHNSHHTTTQPKQEHQLSPTINLQQRTEETAQQQAPQGLIFPNDHRSKNSKFLHRNSYVRRLYHGNVIPPPAKSSSSGVKIGWPAGCLLSLCCLRHFSQLKIISFQFTSFYIQHVQLLIKLQEYILISLEIVHNGFLNHANILESLFGVSINTTNVRIQHWLLLQNQTFL